MLNRELVTVVKEDLRSELLLNLETATRDVYVHEITSQGVTRYDVTALEPFEDDPEYCYYVESFNTLDEAKADAWRVLNEA